MFWKLQNLALKLRKRLFCPVKMCLKLNSMLKELIRAMKFYTTFQLIKGIYKKKFLNGLIFKGKPSKHFQNFEKTVNRRCLKIGPHIEDAFPKNFVELNSSNTKFKPILINIVNVINIMFFEFFTCPHNSRYSLASPSSLSLHAVT